MLPGHPLLLGQGFLVAHARQVGVLLPVGEPLLDGVMKVRIATLGEARVGGQVGP